VNGTDYVDVGQDYYEQQSRQRVLKNLHRKAQALGYQWVEMTPTEETA
jgi:transposase